MIDMSRPHVWCWDARPYPAFSGAHGPVVRRAGMGARSLAERSRRLRCLWPMSWPRSAARRACAPLTPTGCRTGAGYALSGSESGRSALQPLMLAHGFDAVERDGVLRFSHAMRASMPSLVPTTWRWPRRSARSRFARPMPNCRAAADPCRGWRRLCRPHRRDRAARGGFPASRTK